MPTAIIRPAVEVTFTLLGAVGGNSVQVVDSLDPVNHDDDATYAWGELAQVGEYQVQGVPDMGGVSDFKMAHRSDNKAEGNCQEEVRVYANGQWGAYALANVGNGYATQGPTTYGRPGGGVWGPGDFINSSNNFQLGCRVDGNAIAQFPRVTSLWGELYYTEAGGSCFKTDIGMWLAPLLGLGANLLKREIQTLLRGLNVQPSSEEEFEAVKNALAVRPRFCFLGER